MNAIRRQPQTMTLIADGTLTKVSGKCVITGEDHSVEVPTDGLKNWQGGMLMQNAMPNVHPDIREFLISGISPKGWEQIFGKGD